MQKIDSYQNLSKEIASLHITVPLNMLCLNCNDVNQELSARAARLADRMIHYVVDQNRDKNRGYGNHLASLLANVLFHVIPARSSIPPKNLLTLSPPGVTSI